MNKWIDIKNLQEIKDLGSFKQTKEQILRDLNLQGIITFKGFDNMYNFVLSIQKILEKGKLDQELLETANNDSKTFHDLKNHVLESLELSDAISLSSKKEIKLFITKLQEFILSAKKATTIEKEAETKKTEAKKTEVKKVEEKEANKFFISDLHEQAYKLINYNSIYDTDLGITRLHYLSADKAKEWRNQYIKMFHPDQKQNIDMLEEIAGAINKIYRRMVGKS
ncbi:MAG: hypothetical protein ATN31_06875 [Candidatus Epulonipiscioides saccharophilum]|nr:MAG: hypothetical protein ATN31_06875 [Epulopiscium sp. AS2M-Bin001]